MSPAIREVEGELDNDCRFQGIELKATEVITNPSKKKKKKEKGSGRSGTIQRGTMFVRAANGIVRFSTGTLHLPDG